MGNTFSALSFAAIAGTLLAIPGIFIPGMSKIFVDEILLKEKHSWLGFLLLTMGAFILIQLFLGWIQKNVLIRLQLRITMKTASAFFLHLVKLPMNFYQQRSAGDLDQRIESNSSVAQLIAGQLANTAVSIVSLILYGFVMFMFDWILTLIAIAAAVANVLFMIFSRKVQIEENRKMTIELAKQVGVLMNGLQHMETLKAAGRENDFFAKWSGHQAKTSNVQQRIGLIGQLLGSFPNLVDNLVTLSIIGIGGIRVINGDLSLGTLIAVRMLIGSFLLPIHQLMGIWGSLLAGIANMNRLDDVLHYPQIGMPKGKKMPPSCPDMSN